MKSSGGGASRFQVAAHRREDRSRVFGGWVVRAGILLVTGCVVAVSAASFGAESGPQSSASRGLRILEERQCLTCHSISGEGAGTAADLGKRSITSEYSPAGLAALMWNHGPTMWEQMRQRSIEVAPLAVSEADDLFAYFWSLRYFDPRGEAIRGKSLFATKQCATCHSLTSEVATSEAPPVADWAGLSDPELWAQQLWNHSRAMERAMAARGMEWPEFTEQEMVDLLTYLQNLPGTRNSDRQFDLAPSAAGGVTFSARACGTCHSFDVLSSDMVSLKGSRKEFGTVTGFSAAMWNHAPISHTRGTPPDHQDESLTVDEMGDLISYVYFNGGFEENGNPERGRSLFVKKGCQSCHGENSDAFGSGRPFSAASMASAVWSHGPEMSNKMQASGRDWPTLTDRNVADLIAFINE
ncbi:MAG: cytochrome c [Candidatus Sulfomarinibacteraceae bacterium]